MIWYRSKRHNNFSYIIKKWLLQTLLLIGILLVIDYFLIRPNLVNSSYWFLFLPFYSLLSFIQLCQQDRVNEIFIDTDFKEVSFKYYDINEGQVFKTYSFETLRLQISNTKRTLRFLKPIEINFLVGRWEVMSLSKSKDGFSTQDLDNLASALNVLTTPEI
jgi:hypothetical protein